MPDYILRNIDAKTWTEFKQRAESEGRSLRWLILELIRWYIKHGIGAPRR